MAETVGNRLQRIIADHVPQFGGLQPSHFARHIAFRVVNTHLGRQFATHSVRIDFEDSSHLDAAVRECLPTLTRAEREARRVQRAALELAEEMGARVAPGGISEKIAIRVGQYVVRSTKPLNAATVTEFARAVLPSAFTRLSAAEFVRTQSGPYAERWRTHGRAAWRKWPPSKLRLGADRRPPLVGDGPGPAILQGASSPVYGRYSAYFRESARSRAQRCDHDRCRAVRIALDDTLPPRVIAHVCGGLGLAHAEHRRFLQSLTAGLSDQPVARAGGWADYADGNPGLPTEKMDDELSQRVSGHLKVFLAGPKGFRLRQRYGDLATCWDRCERAALLKAYAEVSRWEREHDVPMGRCGAAAVAAISIEAISFVMEDLERQGPSLREQALAAPGTPGGSDGYTERRYRTMDLLMQRHDIPLAHQKGRAEWRTLYQEWANEQGAENLLTAHEFDACMPNGEGQ